MYEHEQEALRDVTETVARDFELVVRSACFIQKPGLDQMATQLTGLDIIVRGRGAGFTDFTQCSIKT